MGFVDKLKNIFFEEEEEEEIEEVKTPKKEKEEIAKRVELPKRKKEVVVEEAKKDFEEEDDDDFFEIKKEPPKKEPSKISDLIFDDEDFILDMPKKEEPKKEPELYRPVEPKEIIKKEEPIKKVEPPIYEYSKQEKETKKTFTPSPIISPIYGILDKNYRKEEVRERKEVRISSRSGKMDLDSVRNKAFGSLETELLPSSETKEEKEETKIERPTRDIKKIREETADEKPVIDKVTLGEADEYFNDLGLAYNTDYKDISKEINDGKIPVNKEKEDKLEDNLFDLIESMYDKEE